MKRLLVMLLMVLSYSCVQASLPVRLKQNGWLSCSNASNAHRKAFDAIVGGKEGSELYSQANARFFVVGTDWYCTMDKNRKALEEAYIDNPTQQQRKIRNFSAIAGLGMGFIGLLFSRVQSLLPQIKGSSGNDLTPWAIPAMIAAVSCAAFYTCRGVLHKWVYKSSATKRSALPIWIKFFAALSQTPSNFKWGGETVSAYKVISSVPLSGLQEDGDDMFAESNIPLFDVDISNTSATLKSSSSSSSQSSDSGSSSSSSSSSNNERDRRELYKKFVDVAIDGLKSRKKCEYGVPFETIKQAQASLTDYRKLPGHDEKVASELEELINQCTREKEDLDKRIRDHILALKNSTDEVVEGRLSTVSASVPSFYESVLAAYENNYGHDPELAKRFAVAIDKAIEYQKQTPVRGRLAGSDAGSEYLRAMSTADAPSKRSPSSSSSSSSSSTTSSSDSSNPSSFSSSSSSLSSSSSESSSSRHKKTRQELVKKRVNIFIERLESWKRGCADVSIGIIQEVERLLSDYGKLPDYNDETAKILRDLVGEWRAVNKKYKDS